MSANLVIEQADRIENEVAFGSVWSLRLDDCTPAQRASLIDFHGKVVEELRRRGHDDIRATVARLPEGEFIVAAPASALSVLSEHRPDSPSR